MLLYLLSNYSNHYSTSGYFVMGSSSTKHKQIFDLKNFNLEERVAFQYELEKMFPTSYDRFWKKYQNFLKMECDDGELYFDSAAVLIGVSEALLKDLKYSKNPKDQDQRRRIQHTGQTVRNTVQTIIDEYKQQTQIISTSPNEEVRLICYG